METDRKHMSPPSEDALRTKGAGGGPISKETAREIMQIKVSQMEKRAGNEKGPQFSITFFYLKKQKYQ